MKIFAARAKGKDFAVVAIGLTSEASPATVPDEPVAPVCPIFPWNELHQILLDLLGIGLARNPKSMREAHHMRVDDDAFVFSEGVAEDNVGRFPSHAREGRAVSPSCQERGRHVRPQSRPLHRGGSLFCCEKNRSNGSFFQSRRSRFRVIGGAPIFREQRRRDGIHSLVGALRGQNRRHQKFERIPEIELAMRVRINLRQRFHQLARPALELSWRCYLWLAAAHPGNCRARPRHCPPRPGKFRCQDGETDWNHNESRPGQNDQGYANQENSPADNRDDQFARAALAT